MGKEYSYVKSILLAEEPNYPEYVSLIGEDGVPVLAEMAKDTSKENISLATKAVYMSSFFRTKQSIAIINEAAINPNPLIKIAAATTLKNLPPSREKLQLTQELIKTDDPSVQKLVLKSIAPNVYIKSDLVKSIDLISQEGKYEFLQQSAKTVLMNRKTGLWAYTKDIYNSWFGPKLFKPG
jgi:hypothetical protein